MNRLAARLAALRAEGRRGVSPFVTAGDGPTLDILRALDRDGVACVELGVPFSDPIADGPVLQAASQRALEAGTTFESVLEILRAFRAESELPVALMGYANPLVRRGFAHAVRAIAEAGGDALLVADLPPEEAGELLEACTASDVCPIFFAAPTSSDERIAAAAAASRGFLYAVGRVGVTGRPTELDHDTQAFLERARRLAGDLPLAVGFGIATPEHVTAACRHADVAIVGSAFVDRLHREGAGAAATMIEELIGGLP